MPTIPSPRRRLFLILFLLAVLVLTAPAGAATILEKSVDVTIGDNGDVVHRRSLRVRLDTAEDVESWSAYPIALNENRELLDVDARVVQADGRTVAVKRRRDRDTMEISTGGTFAGSEVYEVVSFPELRPGSTIEVSYAVREEPYHPSDLLWLREDDSIERLEVTIRGAVENLQWILEGPQEGLELVETEDGLRVLGRKLPAVDPPDAAPGAGWPYSVLRFAWGEGEGWEDVARWYARLLDEVPRGDEAVRRQARELVAGIDDPRERLEALVAFLRRKVRYVAVQMGIGGYRPTPAAETLERGWGDCKDKSLLLIDLLAEAGIPARPALIRTDTSSRVAADLPSPFHFNHLIVAVPADAVPTADGDPLRDGYFFIDPTQTRGAARWLHAGVQDQAALVIEGDAGRLVETPIRPADERRSMTVNLTVDTAGDAVGGASIELSGSVATALVEQIATEPPERTEEIVRAVFSGLLPGVDLGTTQWWEEEDTAVPTVEMVASVRIPGLLQGLDRTSPSFRLEAPSALPSTELADPETRQSPLVLTPRTVEATWHFRLPEGFCRPEEKERVAENDLGSFRQWIVHGEKPTIFTVERRAELRRRWFEPAELADLKELALAERRTDRRRIRLRCEE